MPVQISNYLIGPGWNSTDYEYKINDMTVIVSPKPSQYYFQYTPDNKPVITALIDVQQNVDPGSKVRIKGVMKKGQTVEETKKKNLKMLKSAISDGYSVIFCNVTSKNGVGVTVIGHDSESRTLVKGYESPGSYKRRITYDISMKQIVVQFYF